MGEQLRVGALVRLRALTRAAVEGRGCGVSFSVRAGVRFLLVGRFLKFEGNFEFYLIRKVHGANSN